MDGLFLLFKSNPKQIGAFYHGIIRSACSSKTFDGSLNSLVTNYALDWASPSHGLWSFLMHMQSSHRFEMDTPILLCSWGRAHDHTWYNLNFFCIHCYGCQVSCFVQTNTCSSNIIFLVITMTSEYCSYNTWYSHFGRHSHCWFDLCEFYFMRCFFSGSGCDNCS